MALLKYRPLATAAIFLLLSVALGFFIPLGALVALLALSFCVLLALSILSVKRHSLSYRMLSVLLLTFAVLLGAARMLIDHLGAPHDLEACIDEEVEAALTVREVRYTSAYESELLVCVDRLNEQPNGSLSILRFEGNLPYYIGDRFAGRFTVRAPEYEAYYDGVRYTYLGEGARVLLVCEDDTSIKFLESGTSKIVTHLSDLRAVLSYRITSLCKGESGKLLSAMLLGTRESLSEQTVRDFRRAGISHLLALSGLHLMILVGVLDRFLYLLTAGKRLRMAIVLPFCLLYWVLTGCSFSMLRAVIMLLLLYLAFFLQEDHDAPTALLVCAACIVAITPTALFSTSFQMTVLATLGMLTLGRLQGFFATLLPRKKGIVGVLLECVRYLVASLCVSFAASVAVLPVLWLTFGEISLITPLANLLLVPLSTPLLVLSLLLLLCPIAPLGFAAQGLGNLFLLVANALAAGDVMLSLQYHFVPFVLIPFLLLVILLLLLDLKRLWPLIGAPVPLAIAAFSLCLCLTYASGQNALQTVYRRDGSDEGVILVQNGISVLCDVSNGSLTQWKASWREAQALGATEVEVLMLTHYHSKSVTALSRFSKSVMLRALWVPQPLTAADREILSELLRVAAERKLPVTVYEYETPLRIFDTGVLQLTEPLYESRSTQGAFALSVAFGEDTLCYHTAALSEYMRNSNAAHDCGGKALILGTHGPVPHEVVEIPAHPALQQVVLGSEQILALLSLRMDVSYVAFPERLVFSLGSP